MSWWTRAWGIFAPTPATPPTPTPETGTSGSKYSYPGPDHEFNAKLTPRLWRGHGSTDGICQEMLRSDYAVSGSVLARTVPIQAATWRIVPGGEQPRDLEAADFAEWALFHGAYHRWEDFLGDAMQKLLCGFSLFEVGWHPAEPPGPWAGLLVPSLWSRPAHTVDQWLTEGETERFGGVWQVDRLGQPGALPLPSSRLVRYTHRQHGGNWEGLADARAAYPGWYFKSMAMRHWGIRIERWSTGIPTAEYPTGADAGRINNVLRDIRGNEKAYAGFPKGSDFKIVFPDGEAEQAEFVRQCDWSIATAFLATLLPASRDAAAYTIGASLADLLGLGMDADAAQIERGINEDHDGWPGVLRLLTEWNFPPGTAVPRLTHARIRDVGPIIAQAIGQAVSMGAIVGDDSIDRHLREILGAPPREGDPLPTPGS